MPDVPNAEGQPTEFALHVLPSLQDASLLLIPPSHTAWTIYHHRYAVCLTRTGMARYRYRGVEHAHGAGAVLFFEPGELHLDVKVEAPCAYVIAFFGNLPTLDGRRLPAEPIEQPAMVHRVEALANTFSAGASLLEQEEALIAVSSQLRKTCRRTLAAPTRPARVERAREYLLDNLARNISLAELASVAGLGPDHLLVSFKNTTGLPPHAFQIAARLARARDLLLAGLGGAEVAATVGFSDQAHMVRQFRRAHGMTPTALARARAQTRG